MFPNPFGEYGPDDEQAAGPLPESQRIIQGLLAELPEKAQTLVNKVNREIAKVEEQAEAEAGKVREQAERKAAEIQGKAENRRRVLLEHAMEQLDSLQKDLFRSGELGKALATFVQILAFKVRANNVLPDPGNLMRFEQIGKSFHFQVTGQSQGPIWGTDIYTSDSFLATAAVHAGALEDGEDAVVRVSVVDLSGVAIKGSFRHGVMSHDWGPYRVGYRVARG